MVPTWAQINLDLIHAFPMGTRTSAKMRQKFNALHTEGYAIEANFRAVAALWGGESRLTVTDVRAEVRVSHVEIVFDIAHVFDIGTTPFAAAERAARAAFNAGAIEGSFQRALSPLPGKTSASFREMHLVPEEGQNPSLPGNS